MIPTSIRRVQAAVYQKRWKSIQAALSELEIEAFEAEVIWGQEIKELINSLRRQIGILRANVEMYLRNIKDPPRQVDIKLQEKIESVIYYLAESIEQDKKNSYSERTTEIVNRIEVFLRPKMNL